MKNIKRLHECSDCHARRFVTFLEHNRAGRPKCYGCGSTRLELVSQEGKEEVANLQDFRREQIAQMKGRS